MRLVHEVFNKTIVSIGAKPYLKKLKNKYSSDWIADIVIIVEKFPNQFRSKETIEINGSAKYLIPLFRDVLKQLEFLEEDYIKEGNIKKRKL